MTGNESPFRVKLHGYDQNQVDKLVERVHQTLAGRIAHDAVSVVELQYGVHFDIRMRGYDRRQVQQFVSDSIDALRAKAVAA
jgi:cell division septum initiation protein DivIVA